MSEGFVSVMVCMSFSTVYFPRTKNLFCNLFLILNRTLLSGSVGSYLTEQFGWQKPFYAIGKSLSVCSSLLHAHVFTVAHIMHESKHDQN